MQQNKIIAEVGKGVNKAGKPFWDAYVHYNCEIQPKQQYEQDMAVIAFWEDTFSSPNHLISFASMTYNNVAAYGAYVAIAVLLTLLLWGWLVWL